MLAELIAKYLHSKSIVVFDETGTAGNCFSNRWPATPDEIVGLFDVPGGTPDSKLGYDAPSLQARVRGTTDPRTAMTTAMAIYNELHALGHVTLSDGTFLVTCDAVARPGHIGADDHGRHEVTVNFTTEIRNEFSKHRE